MITLHGNAFDNGDGTYDITGDGWNDGLTLPTIPFTAGKTLFCDFTLPDADDWLMRVGFGNDPTDDGTLHANPYPLAGILIAKGHGTKAQEWSGNPSIASWHLHKKDNWFGPGGTYSVAIEMQDDCFIVHAKGGAFGASWDPLWRSTLLPGGTIQPFVASARAGTTAKVTNLELLDTPDMGGTVLDSIVGGKGCHGPSLATDGTRLLAHWQRGLDHRDAGVEVWHAYSDNAGRTWTRELVAEATSSRWVSHGVVGYAAGKWWEFLVDLYPGVVPPLGGNDSDATKYRTSDDGINWGPWQTLPATGRCLVFNRPVAWGGHTYVTYTTDGLGGQPHATYVLRTADDGATWSTPVKIPGPSSQMEGTLAIEGSGMTCFMRTPDHCLRESRTTNGIDWTRAIPVSSPNPNSRAEFVDGRLIGNLSGDNNGYDEGQGRSPLCEWSPDLSEVEFIKRSGPTVALGYPHRAVIGGRTCRTWSHADRRMDTPYSMIVFQAEA